MTLFKAFEAHCQVAHQKGRVPYFFTSSMCETVPAEGQVSDFEKNSITQRKPSITNSSCCRLIMYVKISYMVGFIKWCTFSSVAFSFLSDVPSVRAGVVSGGTKKPRVPHFVPCDVILFFLTPLFFGRLFLVGRRQDGHLHGGSSRKKCWERDGSIQEQSVGLPCFTEGLGAPSLEESDLTASSCP